MSYDFTFVCYNNLIGVEKYKRNNELDINTYYNFQSFASSYNKGGTKGTALGYKEPTNNRNSSIW